MRTFSSGSQRRPIGVTHAGGTWNADTLYPAQCVVVHDDESTAEISPAPQLQLAKYPAIAAMLEQLGELIDDALALELGHIDQAELHQPIALD
jgi:hypothetical protein